MNRITENDKTASFVKPQWQTVIDYLNANGKITEGELQKLFNVKRTRAYNVAKQMVEAGIISVSRRGENKIYRLK